MSESVVGGPYFEKIFLSILNGLRFEGNPSFSALWKRFRFVTRKSQIGVRSIYAQPVDQVFI